MRAAAHRPLLLVCLAASALAACPGPSPARDAAEEPDGTADVASDIAPPDAPDDAPLDASAPDAARPDAPAPDAIEPVMPRLIAPLSTAAVTSRRPTLRFRLAAGAADARVELCAARDCAAVEATLEARGTSVTPATELAPGVHYWRLVVGATRTPVWEFFVGARSAPRDASWGSTADVDGDGLADVIVGASHARAEAGRAFVYRGARSGFGASAPAVLEAPAAEAGHFGWSLASAGDVNGDGFADVIVGAPDVSSGIGRAYVFHGGAAGLATTPAVTLATTDPAGNYGTSVASVGDVNGDGFADVMVGAPSANSYAGRAFLYYGGPEGITPTPALVIDGPGGAGDTLGVAVASAGDVNADGFADVLVGAPGARGTAGRAFVYLGGPTGIGAISATLDSPSTIVGQFGVALTSAGDVNGDGFADVIVGANGTENGDVWIYLGGASGLATTPASALTGPDGLRGGFGWSVAGAGDLNGDGFGDFVIGAVCAPFGYDPDGGYPSCGPGRAYGYVGSAVGLASTTPVVTLAGPMNGEPAGFAWSLASGGDVNGDGHADLVVGAEAAGNFTGVVTVFAGTASGAIDPTPLATLHGPDGAGANYGWSVAL